MTLDEIPYWRDGTLEKYTPSGDYVVIKFARWAFEKFTGSQDKLGTQMKAVGEVMSIGKNYKEAFQKAIRSLEIGRYGLGGVKDFAEKRLDELINMMSYASSERQFIMYEALRKGADVQKLYELTHIKPYFIQQMKELVELEEEILTFDAKNVPDDLLIKAKKDGFADRYLAKLLNCDELEISNKREALGLTEGWEPVPVSGVENAAYYFSSYNQEDVSPAPSSRPKVMILGGGPNRIGQGIEFDYCCVHAAFTLRDMGYETIIVNCNPETVSTDYDTSDKLYFEPLTVEDVMSIYNKEKPVGIIAQFGGQTPLNLAAKLEEMGVKILGTSPATIDMAEDRDQFRAMMERLGIPMPKAGTAINLEQARIEATRIGYPVMVRPSYVLGGAGMRVVHNDVELEVYMQNALNLSEDHPVLIDRFLQHAMEVEADAISDGKSAFVPAVMEHIELAGIHSGDSACVLPSVNISEKHLETIKEYTRNIAVEMGVKGLLNIQYAIADGIVYILEANPRASRTVPLVSKVCDVQMVSIATRIIMSEHNGNPVEIGALKEKKINHYGVKEAVFPFNMFPEVDPVLGPEMHSTGEVLGLADTFGTAFYKAQEAANLTIPLKGAFFISVNDDDKEEALEVAKELSSLGFEILSTVGTARYFSERGVNASPVKKLHEGSNEIIESIESGRIQAIANTPTKTKNASDDDSYIRKSAIKKKLAYYTTVAAAKAAAVGIKEVKNKTARTVKSLQQYHSEIV